ncbi:hypothetical protein PR048_027880 [Dryococelus australis]|uniref:Uncharacterized protein n=1 Tax=Dryococelus australis TaxID=614101 RepID=A0ABQ9GHS3_9NEOP|nr:hypothetical protein PR048_027880 [Dryococelus australis]
MPLPACASVRNLGPGQRTADRARYVTAVLRDSTPGQVTSGKQRSVAIATCSPVILVRHAICHSCPLEIRRSPVGKMRFQISFENTTRNCETSATYANFHDPSSSLFACGKRGGSCRRALLLRAGFEPATYGYLLHNQLQSTALPTELPEEFGNSGTIRTCDNPGVTRSAIEPCSPWWEAGSLTAQPPRPREGTRKEEGEGSGVETEVVTVFLLERLACSPPTKANRVQSPAGSLPGFRMWESCRWLAGFLGDFPFPPALSYRRCSILTSINLAGYLELG